MQACLIRGAEVLTLEGPQGLQPQRLDILLREGRIAELAPDLSPPSDAMVHEARGKLVIPGLVNAHLHSSEMFFRGRYERMALETWLGYAYPFFAAEPVGLRLLYLRSMLVAIESLRGGVTMISDDFFDPPKHDLERLATVFRAYGDIGIRANVSSGLMNLPYLDTLAFGREVVPPDIQAALEFPLPTARDYTAYCEEVFRHLHGSYDGRLRFMLAPSGPQRCTPDLMLACMDLARQHAVPYHTHVLETRVQAVTGTKVFGGSLVRYMDDLGLLHPGVLMAHAVWVSDDDIARMGAAGVSVSYNAIANLKLGSGLCPVRKLLDGGVNIGLGTDGASSNDTMRIFDVMRVAALVQTLQDTAPERWLAAHEVLHAATLGGAKAALLDHETGSIRPGKKADLAFLDLSSGTAFTPNSDAVRQLVYCENGSSVTDVMVDGVFVLQAGRLTRIDEAAVLEEIRDVMGEFLARHRAVEAANAGLVPLFEEIRRRCAQEPLPG
ncbi:amidohydrolase family protein [Stappia sp. TSB10GB4]|uniref:amidohydrolase family protein n=1 Tax=Stappia sp. TSB10GB4 TaxID=2003584 RepID=UPI001646FBCA|nr:amidohydrolase family protein [Stappia sp. TSB10GB4]